MAKLTLSTPINQMFGVGPKYTKRLKKLDITTAQDLLYHLPSRYEDYSQVKKISNLEANKPATVVGEVVTVRNLFTKSKKRLTKLKLEDRSGQIEVTWFNQPYLKKTLPQGTKVAISGQPGYFGSQLTFTSPEYEVIKPSKKLVHTARLVPIYPETRGVSSKWLRAKIKTLVKHLVPQINDFLPQSIVKNQNLPDLRWALKQVHQPESIKNAQKAKNRLAFNEMFLLQLSVLQRQNNWQKKSASYNFSCSEKSLKKFFKQLPFKLTQAQNQAIEEIFNDLKKTKPMNRILQGDVGSGKTVVAASAIYTAFLNKAQSVIMAPTEILAQQHFSSLKKLLGPLGLSLKLVTSSTQAGNNQADLVVGTQALLFKKFSPKKTGLVVIDEQHRFGVAQRGKLLKKTVENYFPHLLTMTATPIPRTIALTAYGDLDLSTLDQMPPGRKPVKTWVVSPQKRPQALDWLKSEIQKNQTQAFIVYPLIEPSEAETLKDVRAAQDEFEKLKSQLKPLKLDLLHGRIKSAKKQKTIKDFARGKTQVLVCTPVVEVGIDIPQATIMMIEGGERFGLAQLHQLRGRVGRGKKQSYCVILPTKPSQKDKSRLQLMAKINNGIKLAQADLDLRGPGEVYGLKQHGFTQFKAARLNDYPLIKATRKAAQKIAPQLKRFPDLKLRLKEFKISYVLPN